MRAAFFDDPDLVQLCYGDRLVLLLLLNFADHYGHIDGHRETLESDLVRLITNHHRDPVHVAANRAEIQVRLTSLAGNGIIRLTGDGDRIAIQIPQYAVWTGR